MGSEDPACIEQSGAGANSENDGAGSQDDHLCPDGTAQAACEKSGADCRHPPKPLGNNIPAIPGEIGYALLGVTGWVLLVLAVDFGLLGILW